MCDMYINGVNRVTQALITASIFIDFNQSFVLYVMANSFKKKKKGTINNIYELIMLHLRG